MEKITIIGTGVMGLSLAALFSKSTAVQLISHQGSLKELEFSILLDGKDKISCREKVSTIGEVDISNCKYIFLCMRAQYLNSSIQKLLPQLHKEQTLVCIQNGLGIYDSAAQAVHNSNASPNIARLLCRFGARRINSQEIALIGSPQATLAQMTKVDPELASICRSVGFTLTETNDIPTAEWQKALINCVINPLASILNQPNSIILLPEFDQLTYTIFSEARSVAIADGAQVHDVTFEDIKKITAHVGDNINSNLTDLRAGRESDMDYLLKVILLRAKKYAIETPSLEALYRIFNYFSHTQIHIEKIV